MKTAMLERWKMIYQVSDDNCNVGLTTGQVNPTDMISHYLKLYTRTLTLDYCFLSARDAMRGVHVELNCPTQVFSYKICIELYYIMILLKKIRNNNTMTAASATFRNSSVHVHIYESDITRKMPTWSPRTLIHGLDIKRSCLYWKMDIWPSWMFQPMIKLSIFSTRVLCTCDVWINWEDGSIPDLIRLHDSWTWLSRTWIRRCCSTVNASFDQIQTWSWRSAWRQNNLDRTSPDELTSPVRYGV